MEGVDVPEVSEEILKTIRGDLLLELEDGYTSQSNSAGVTQKDLEDLNNGLQIRFTKPYRELMIRLCENRGLSRSQTDYVIYKLFIIENPNGAGPKIPNEAIVMPEDLGSLLDWIKSRFDDYKFQWGLPEEQEFRLRLYDSNLSIEDNVAKLLSGLDNPSNVRIHPMLIDNTIIWLGSEIANMIESWLRKIFRENPNAIMYLPEEYLWLKKLIYQDDRYSEVYDPNKFLREYYGSHIYSRTGAFIFKFCKGIHKSEEAVEKINERRSVCLFHPSFILAERPSHPYTGPSPSLTDDSDIPLGGTNAYMYFKEYKGFLEDVRDGLITKIDKSFPLSKKAIKAQEKLVEKDMASKEVYEARDRSLDGLVLKMVNNSYGYNTMIVKIENGQVVSMTNTGKSANTPVDITQNRWERIVFQGKRVFIKSGGGNICRAVDLPDNGLVLLDHKGKDTLEVAKCKEPPYFFGLRKIKAFDLENSLKDDAEDAGTHNPFADLLKKK